MKHHCLRCKEKTIMTKVTIRPTDNGRFRIQAKCKVCGANMSRMLPMIRKDV